MKKLMLVGALALFAAVNAQVSTSTEGFAQGSTFITGAVGFASESIAEEKTSGFTIAPSVGYFVTPNIAIGAKLGYTSLKNEEGSYEETTDLLTAGVFGRYYWMPASKFSIFAELGADYRSLTEDDNTISNEYKSNGFAIQLAPGMNYFLNNNFALEAKVGVLGYSSDKPDYTGAEATDNFNIGLNLNDITLGLVYKF